MTDVLENPNKKLAGGAKNYLDDLDVLNAKTTEEMLRGIGEGYLDADGAVELADKLGIERPRVRRTFHFYFTETVAHSLGVSAFDEEAALREAQRMHEFNIAHGQRYYGSSSRFDNDGDGLRRAYSDLQATRTTVAEVTAAQHNPHPWQQERVQMLAAGNQERHVRSELSQRLRHETLIEEDRRQPQDRIH